MKAIPKHRRLIIGARKIRVWQYSKPYLPEFSDDHPIACAKFSNKRFEIYVAAEQSIKIWDARSGRPVRVLKNVFSKDDANTEIEDGVKKVQSEITTMEFDEHHRKLIIGDSLGHLRVFDILSGVMTHELQAHGKEDGEISFIGYGGDDGTIITIGWDRTIKIHRDDASEMREPSKKVLRGTANCHSREVISGDYAHYLGFIATGGRGAIVKVWDYERV